MTMAKVVNEQVSTRTCRVSHLPTAWCYRKPRLPKRGGMVVPCFQPHKPENIAPETSAVQHSPRQYVVYIPRDTVGGLGFLFDILVPEKHFIYKKYFFIFQLFRFRTVCSMKACLFCVCTLVFRNSVFTQQKPEQSF